MARALSIFVVLLAAAATSGCWPGPVTRMAIFEPYDPRPVSPYDQRGWDHPRGYAMYSDDGLIQPTYRERKPRIVMRQSEPARETVGRSEAENGSAPRVVNTPEWLAKEAVADERVKRKMIICRGC